ncbi:MAG: aminotransferase [Nevskia sp.]|nr:aminotransferase [Nevskia sp.]
MSGLPSYKAHFSRFLNARPGRLHAAAHSHHPWPDASFEAQQRAWLDAAELMDRKWDKVLGEVLPRAQAHVARRLALPSPDSLCFAPNTHELVMRLLSCIERRPLRVLTTDAEFHSFARQLLRLEEAGQARAERVAAEPFDTFAERFGNAAARGGHDLVYFSQCFFNSGFLVQDPGALAGAVRDEATLVAIDGYHAFMALPVDLSALTARVFYLAGGYKYAMAGEGACFMHCPPGYAPRPLDTGWFAGFAGLPGPAQAVDYAPGGMRFMGATFDPTALYRLNASLDLCDTLALDPATIHARVMHLQQLLLAGLERQGPPVLGRHNLVPAERAPRGNFLSFRHPEAAALCARLQVLDVVTDCRDDRLRIGLGVYHDPADIDDLLRRLGLCSPGHVS